MGFLDHSTNNVQADAVLTDLGREFLSRNDGSFSAFKFAVGDAEVSYDIIQKYGRTIGKEKIEKNTPIFQAITDRAQAQKSKLVYISNPNLVYMPTIYLNLAGSTATSVALTTAGSVTTSTVKVEQRTSAASIQVDPDLVDETFDVVMRDDYLFIPSSSPVSKDSDNRSTYSLQRTGPLNSYGGSVLQFNLQTKSLSDEQFNLFDGRAIVEIVGTKSGAVTQFEVTITKT